MRAMERRHLLGAGLALACAGLAARPAEAALSAADRAEITRAQAYLDSITTLKARFLQVAPDGSTATGTAWLDRPGRMRFQYDPPSPLLLVAGHGLFVYYDASLQQTSNLPLASTPLGLLLQRHLRLSGDVTVTAVRHRPGELILRLVRTRNPAQGSLTLVFADPPLVLRQWQVEDARHQVTQVTLYNIETGGRFKPSLFTFIDPKFFHNNQH